MTVTTTMEDTTTTAIKTTTAVMESASTPISADKGKVNQLSGLANEQYFKGCLP